MGFAEISHVRTGLDPCLPVVSQLLMHLPTEQAMLEAPALAHRLAVSNSVCARGACCALVATTYGLPPLPGQLQLRVSYMSQYQISLPIEAGRHLVDRCYMCIPLSCFVLFRCDVVLRSVWLLLFKMFRSNFLGVRNIGYSEPAASRSVSKRERGGR